MTKLSANQKLVVARVLSRYIGKNPGMDYNKALIEALTNWIGGNTKTLGSLPIRAYHTHSL